MVNCKENIFQFVLSVKLNHARAVALPKIMLNFFLAQLQSMQGASHAPHLGENQMPSPGIFTDRIGFILLHVAACLNRTQLAVFQEK